MVRTGRANDPGIITVAVPMLTVQGVAHRALQQMMLIALTVQVTKQLKSRATAKLGVSHRPRSFPSRRKRNVAV